MPKNARFTAKLRRFALPGAAFLLAVISVSYGVGNCARDQRERAYAERYAPLAKALKEHRPLLARAAALQPNFKELTAEITPSRCREIVDLIRARYELDPFHIQGSCERSDVTTRLAVCEGARVFADLGGAESQLGSKVGVVLQARKRIDGKAAGGEPAPQLEVTTLLLGDDHRIIELHELRFPDETMSGKPFATTIRASGPDGLLERADQGTRTTLLATTTDGAIQLYRVENGQDDRTIERVRGAKAKGWSKVHLLPTSGAWFATPDGIRCTAPSWSELVVERRNDSVTCTRVRIGDGASWDRGDCDSAG